MIFYYYSVLHRSEFVYVRFVFFVHLCAIVGLGNTAYSGSIIAANNSSMEITHSGKMILPGTNETIDALLCPSAIRYLISGAMLSKIGYTTILNPDGTGKLSKNDT